ncbi:MAG: DUF4197 domain-containing protein [Flavobacteriia bacterium]
MKKTFILLLSLSSMILFTACEVLNEAASLVNSTTTTNTTTQPSLTNAEVISGLKEALNVGIKNSVSLTSVTDGFLKNTAIRLPFPPDAIKVKQKALDLGLSGQVEKFETTLNRAAEEATKEALPIFAEAIKNMSISDGFAILNGGDGSATKFLRDNTTQKLVAAFSPKVQAAISTVKLTEYWEPLITKYNAAMAICGGHKLNPYLYQYVTEKAFEGLLYMVAIEENKIRKDPMARVTDILQKVFGSLTQR